MQMTVEDYEQITVGQFLSKWIGFVDLIRIREENEWKRVNYAAFHNLMNNPFIDRKDKPKDFEEFLHGKKVRKLTKQEFEDFLNG